MKQSSLPQLPWAGECGGSPGCVDAIGAGSGRRANSNRMRSCSARRRAASSSTGPAAATASSGSDDALRLIPPSKLSLEQSLEFIKDDELVEVTPHNIRLRKRILRYAFFLGCKKIRSIFAIMLIF